MPFLFLHNSLDIEAITRTVHAVRSQHNTDVKFMPIIMMTGDNSMGAVRQFLSIGFDDIVLTPFDAEVLRGRLERQIDRQHHYYQTGDYFGPDRRKHQQSTPHPERRGGVGYAYRHFVIQRDPASGVHILLTETFNADNTGIAAAL